LLASLLTIIPGKPFPFFYRWAEWPGGEAWPGIAFVTYEANFSNEQSAGP
jgi:hypothetical protein